MKEHLKEKTQEFKSSLEKSLKIDQIGSSYIVSRETAEIQTESFHIPDIQRHTEMKKTDLVIPMSPDKDAKIVSIPKLINKNMNTDLDVLQDSVEEISDEDMKESALFAQEFIRGRNINDILLFSTNKSKRRNPVLSKIKRNLRYSKRSEIIFAKSLNRYEKFNNQPSNQQMDNGRNNYHVFLSQNRNSNLNHNSKDFEDSMEIIKRNKNFFEHYNWNIANFVNK